MHSCSALLQRRMQTQLLSHHLLLPRHLLMNSLQAAVSSAVLPWVLGASRLSQQSCVQAQQRNEEVAAERTRLEEANLPLMLEAMWAANLIDIQSTVRSVCRQVACSSPAVFLDRRSFSLLQCMGNALQLA